MNDRQQQNALDLRQSKQRKQWLENLCTQSLAEVLPQHITPTEMLQIAYGEMSRNPDLQICDPTTLALCLLECAALGFKPSGPLGHAYLIPRWSSKRKCKECTMIVGYKGYLDLAHRSGLIRDCAAEVVYQGEEFLYRRGNEAQLVHGYSFDTEMTDENILGSWCEVNTLVGGTFRKVLNRSQIEERRERGASGRGSKTPWDTDYAAMARKSAVRALFTGGTVPLSAEIQQALLADGDTDNPAGPVYSHTPDQIPAHLRRTPASRSKVLEASYQSAAPNGNEDTRDEPLPFDLRADPPGPKDLRDLLRIAGQTLTARTIETWSKQQAKAAESWAVAVENQRRGYHPDDRSVHAGNVPLPDHMAPSKDDAEE